MKDLRSDNRGLAHIAMIALVVLVVGAVGFVGWRVMNKDKSVDSVANQAAATECKKEIDDDDFCKFVSNWASLGAYTTVMSSTGAGGSSSITMESDGGERSHVTTSTDGKVAAESITIGSTTYTKDITDGKWTKYTSPDYKPADFKDEIDVDFTDTTKPEAERTTYKKIGKEACGSLTCFKYQIIDPARPTDEQFVWFDDKDYMIRRMLFTNAEGSTDMSFSYDSVSISEPSPIKEASTNTPTPEEIQQMIDAYSTQSE